MLPRYGGVNDHLVESLWPIIRKSVEDTIRMLHLPPGSIAHYISVDISGPDERDDYVGCGSVGGITLQMNAFDQLWKAMLLRYQVPYIRMAEAMSFRGAFKQKAVEWGDQREQIRDQTLLQAAEIARGIPGQVASHNTRDLSPKVQRSKYGTQLLFATLMRKIVYEKSGESRGLQRAV